MTNTRKGHVAFKIENNLYVAGGYNRIFNNASCERYDIKKNKWFSSKHTLPQALTLAHSSVSLDESFSVITGRISDRITTYSMIIFTEQCT